MAHTKAKGTSKLGRESESKRLGIKVWGGQPVKGGGIIVRQRGSKYYAGKNVAVAGDDTLYAVSAGVVQFKKKKVKKFTNKLEKKTIVSVLPK
jgi:large subunit ribosomal protein L27